MKTMIRFFSASLFLLPLLLHGPAVAAMSIAVTSAWYETIDKNDLTLGAGSDLQDTYTSVSGQVTIDISGATDPDDTWRVEIRKVDSTWNNQLHPWARRTSSGTGGSVSGGMSYQEVTTVNSSFFTGAGNVTGINLQLKLTGASIQVPPSSYSTMFYYTVVDTP